MKEKLLSTLQNSKSFSLAVADAMPANLYQTKPAGASWDFGELLAHMAYGIQWWETNFIKGTKSEWDPPPPRKNKKEIMAGVESAYESLRETLAQSSLDDNQVYGFWATLDHITHHRGQAVLHLRCQGIVPPEYTF